MEPLVFLPGMMCDARLFAPQIEALSRTRAVQVGCLAGPESHANFVLIPFADAATAGAADKALRAGGLLVRGMGGYGLPQCLRVTVGAAEAMRDVARILAPFGKD